MYMFLNYRTNEENRMFFILNYRTNEEKYVFISQLSMIALLPKTSFVFLFDPIVFGPNLRMLSCT